MTHGQSLYTPYLDVPNKIVEQKRSFEAAWVQLACICAHADTPCKKKTKFTIFVLALKIWS